MIITIQTGLKFNLLYKYISPSETRGKHILYAEIRLFTQLGDEAETLAGWICTPYRHATYRICSEIILAITVRKLRTYHILGTVVKQMQWANLHNVK